MSNIQLIQGDCLRKLKELDDNSVDSIVTDPPYGLSFMGKKWDYDVPTTELWEEAIRVLKPGGHLLAFFGTRTYHRGVVRIEDAGFEIRDTIFWTYASGFPKSHNVWKTLKKKCECGIMEEYEKSRNEQRISLQQKAEHDLRFMRERNLSQTINPEKEQGEVLQSELSQQGSQVSGDTTSDVREGQPCVERGSNLQTTEGQLPRGEVCEMSQEVSTNGEKGRIHNGTQTSDGSTLEQNADQDGSSSSRRPQSEQQQDREPCAFCKQHFTQAIRAYGFGSAIKPACEPITLARKPISTKNIAKNVLKWGTGGINIDKCRVKSEDSHKTARKPSELKEGAIGYLREDKPKFGGNGSALGRFPANLIHDGSDEVVGLFPETKGGGSQRGSRKWKGEDGKGGYGGYAGKVSTDHYISRDDGTGSAARFFYCAKASKSERNAGLEGFEEKSNMRVNAPRNNEEEKHSNKMSNFHPTVKPIKLMQYLCRLVTPKGGTVLDPFMGSGSTGIASKKEGFNFIGIELDKEYYEIAKSRIDKSL